MKIHKLEEPTVIKNYFGFRTFIIMTIDIGDDSRRFLTRASNHNLIKCQNFYETLKHETS